MLDGVACNMWNPVAGREQLAHSFPKQAWFVPSIRTSETYYDLLGPVGCGLLYLCAPKLVFVYAYVCAPAHIHVYTYFLIGTLST